MGITSLSQAQAVTPPGMVYITSGSASAASSLSINNCFSATYDNYRIVVAGLTSSTNTDILLRLRASGTDNSTAANYKAGRYYIGSQITTAAGSSDGSSGLTYFYAADSQSTTTVTAVIDVTNPYAAIKTGYTAIATGWTTMISSGLMTVTTAYDGFSLVTSAGTLTVPTGGVRVYGYRNS